LFDKSHYKEICFALPVIYAEGMTLVPATACAYP